MVVNEVIADGIDLMSDAFVVDQMVRKVFPVVSSMGASVKVEEPLTLKNENKNSSPVADKVPLSYVCRQCYNCVYRNVKHSGHTR